ncbi:MAG: GNAT family N-acetyltransferase [Bacteriovoracaceae bacterium]|nr:GNAT family N-acetyltransferase [Bacteriovoracaceae bacterium]
MKITCIETNPDSLWNHKLIDLEKSITYPLGEDRFHLDHGKDYFAFFRRLGEIHCYLAHKGDEILGLGQGILRLMPDGKKAWYLCDLKVTPKARGKKITYQLFKKAFLKCYLKCSRGYGVTMDPAAGENPIVKLSANLPWTPLKVSDQLAFFTLTYDQMMFYSPLLKIHRGEFGYLSHKERKEIILQSTQKPMNLWHLQWGPFAESQTFSPIHDGLHMFTVPLRDPLYQLLLRKGLTPSAFAHILSHKMKHTNWAFILSSDI